MLVDEYEFMKILSETISEISDEIDNGKAKVFIINLNMSDNSNELASVLLRSNDKDIEIVVNKEKSMITINDSSGKSIKYESEIDSEKVLHKLLYLIDLIHPHTPNYGLYLRIDFYENNETESISG